MSSNGSTHKPSDGALQQQNFKSSSLPGSPRMPASPANSIPSSSSSSGGGGIKVKIKRTSSTDSRQASNNSNGSKANFMEAPLSESPGSNSSLMEFSIDNEMSNLSNSSSSNSKSDNGVSQKYVGGVSTQSGKSSNVLKRHLDGYPMNSGNPPPNYPSLQPNSIQNHPKREPPVKKTKINGGSTDDLLNGDFQKGAPKASTQQNNSLPSSSASSSSHPKMVISNDAASHINANDKLALQNGINSNSEGNNLNDSSFTPSVLNYALTSTSSPSSQTSSIPESELVLDPNSGLLIKKSDEISNSDSPIIDLNGSNSNEKTVGTMTDPDSLGPCEPGTAVKLQGIVWQETDKGLLVLNVTWKNKTFMGTLLDCHRQSDSHKWAGPKDPQSLSKKGKRGRGSRSRTPPVKLPMSKKNKNKLISGGPNNRNNGTIPESPLSKDSINNRRRLPPVNYGESDDEDVMPKDDESGDESTNPPNESLSPSSRLIECPKPQCFKKFRDLDALKYHLSYTHNDLKDEKPPNKKLKKRKKLLAKRKREANAKEVSKVDKNNVKKENETSLADPTSKSNDNHIKKEIKMEASDSSTQNSSKIVQNGGDYSLLGNVKTEALPKNSSNVPSSSTLYNSHYQLHGSSTNPQPLALTSASSSILPQNSNNVNSPGLPIGSSSLKSSSSQHNINYLMSNPQQQPLNFEKTQGSPYQPPPAHGGSNHSHNQSSPLVQNGTRGALSFGKDLDGRLSSFAQNGSNDLRTPGYQPSPINLGSSKDSLTNKSQNSVQLQRQRSSGGPASPAYSDISDEESTTIPTSASSSSGNGTTSNNKIMPSRGLPLGSNQSIPQVRPMMSDQVRKNPLQSDSARSSAPQQHTSGERKTDGTKPTTQTIGPPPQHLPPELHGGSLAFPPHLAHSLAGLPPGFPPHLMASLAASMGAAAGSSGHRFPSPIPPIPGLPGSSTKALDILQQHANQYMATSKLQELQDRAGQVKTTGASNSTLPLSSSVPKSTSPSLTNLLGVNRGNVATASPPLLRHEHNHTHLHLGYPPPGLPGLSSPGGASVSLPSMSNSSPASSMRGVAPPSGSITVPGSPSPSQLPQPSPSSLMSGLFSSGSPGSPHNLRLSSSAFPPK